MASGVYQVVRAGAGCDVRRGLLCLMGGPERVACETRTVPVEEHVQTFEQYAAANGLDLRRQVVALDDGRVVGMALWVPAVGKTAMIFSPNLTEYPDAAEATAACLTTVLADAQAAGVVLVQALLDPADGAGVEVFASAGLESLATLVYMERTPPLLPPLRAVEFPPGIRLEAYARETHEAFKKAIGRSYEATLDCPRLSGLRDLEDVIAGHRAVGRFDPQLWGVLIEGEKVLGCLLLAEVPQRNALDLVYLGLAPEARGRGLGRLLLQRMLGIGTRRSFAVLSLAVDAGNTPALRLYRRFGFGEVTRRVAMVRPLRGGRADGLTV